VEQNTQRNRAARARKRNQRPTLFHAAISGTEGATPAVLHDLGAMRSVCDNEHCQAWHFAAEHGDMLHSCCHNGKAMAPPLSDYPDELWRLLTGVSNESKNFREHLRQYNCANAFASFGATIEKFPPGRGPYCFKIRGAVHHSATSALVEVRLHCLCILSS